jgi:hypothetical protein
VNRAGTKSPQVQIIVTREVNSTDIGRIYFVSDCVTDLIFDISNISITFRALSSGVQLLACHSNEIYRVVISNEKASEKFI